MQTVINRLQGVKLVNGVEALPNDRSSGRVNAFVQLSKQHFTGQKNKHDFSLHVYSCFLLRDAENA